MVKIKDLSGQRFSRLVAVEKVGSNQQGRALWKCKCECGNQIVATSTNLISGNTKSCGCLSNDKKKERFTDITGKRFGRLIVLRKTNKRSEGHVVWLCKCDCGNRVMVSVRELNSGKTRSCGCLRREAAGKRYHDLAGKRFGRLVVENKTDRRMKSGGVIWKCKCDCGNETYVSAKNLVSKQVQSCGCLQLEINSQRLEKSTEHKKMINSKKGKSLVDKTYLPELKGNLRSTNTSGVTGVSWFNRTQKWVARIVFQGKQIWLGSFADKQDAIRVRKEAEEKYFKPILEKYDQPKE